MAGKCWKHAGKPLLTAPFVIFLPAQFDRVTLPRYFRYLDKIPENAQGKRFLQISSVYLTRVTTSGTSSRSFFVFRSRSAGFGGVNLRESIKCNFALNLSLFAYNSLIRKEPAPHA